MWRRVFALAWPVMAEQTLRTLMRTVDVVVTAGFHYGDWADRAASVMVERRRR